MRVLITGSRTWDDYSIIFEALKEYGSNHVLVSGNCPMGADFLCEKAAEELGWDVELFPANWEKYGKRAGFLRNSEMVETSPDICLGFVHNKSKGAAMTVRLAKQAGVLTKEYSLTGFGFEKDLVIKIFNQPNGIVLEKNDNTESFLF